MAKLSLCSEKEVNRAWPSLKEKLAKSRQSRDSLNYQESDNEISSDSGHVSNPPAYDAPKVSLPRKSSKEVLL